MSLKIDLRGMPETKAMLAKVSDRELSNRTRRALRRGAGVFRDELRRQARTRDDLPRTFAKTKTQSHRNPLGVSVRPTSPLVAIYEHGADDHDIGESGQLLVNPEAGFMARGPVHHPGMDARPLLGPAFDAAKDEAADAFADELFAGMGR